MDSERNADPSILGSESECDRDLRDVLRHLVVVEGDRGKASLSAVAEAAGRNDRLVPELLVALEDDATAVRVGAAWTLCALADDQPAAVEYLATRLTDRVDDGPFEVGQVFSYLRGRYPGRVADAVDVAVETPGGDAVTNGGAGKRVETDGGVPAGTVADLGEGRQVVRPSGQNGPTTPVEPDRPRRAGSGGPVRRGQPPADPPRDHPTHPEFESVDADDATPADPAIGQADATQATEASADRATSAATDASRSTDRPETPDTFAAIGSLSSLDRLSAVDTGVETRYAEGYRCRAVRDDEEHGVEVRLFDRPDEDDHLAFQGDLEDCLARWQALDTEGVVGVTEWGRRPRPWVRTAPVDASLAERGPPDVARALDQAVDLAEAVAGLHARGAVHTGLDPRNVVYPCEMGALERPMLDNVGLMDVFRQYFEPSNYLDPRFAAPEYFDADFGGVDAATDVYGLGAVVYYLLTGRPPFDGSYGEIRNGVLKERPPAPSDVTDAAPPRVDPVLAKALAKSKLGRYDAVETFLADLENVRNGE